MRLDKWLKNSRLISSSQSPLYSVSACGENSDSSLAPPLPTKSFDFVGTPMPLDES